MPMPRRRIQSVEIRISLSRTDQGVLEHSAIHSMETATPAMHHHDSCMQRMWPRTSVAPQAPNDVCACLVLFIRCGNLNLCPIHQPSSDPNGHICFLAHRSTYGTISGYFYGRYISQDLSTGIGVVCTQSSKWHTTCSVKCCMQGFPFERPEHAMDAWSVEPVLDAIYLTPDSSPYMLLRGNFD